MWSRHSFKLRVSLSPNRTTLGSRLFSRSVPASNIHSEILSVLREEPPVESQSVLPEKKKNILILSPEQTKNKDFEKYVATIGKRKPRSRSVVNLPEMNELDFSSDLSTGVISDSDILSSIDNFKPGSHKQSASFSVKSAASGLTASFTRAQLASYVEQRAPSHYRPSHKKGKLADTIVTKIWGESGGAVSNFLVREQVPLTHQEMFLLLSQRGFVLRLLKATVTSVDFDAKKNELVLLGTESQIQNAKLNLANKFDNAVREEIDLGAIQQLSERKASGFSFQEIGKLIEVYFQHLKGDKYQLCAFSSAQVKRIKRLLVWYLDYNLHSRKILHLPAEGVLEGAALEPHSDEYSMVWKDRSKAHFELIDETRIRNIPRSLSRELKKYSDESIEKASNSMDFNVSRDYFSESGVTDETFDSISGSGVLAEDSLEDVIDDLVSGSTEEGAEATRSQKSESGLKSGYEALVSKDSRDQIYTELTDFNQYRSKLRGVRESELDEPMFTVTLGKVLFSHEKDRTSVLPEAPQKDPAALSKNYTFTTNISSIYDKALHDGVADEDSGDQYTDPHTYSLQFKFLPSPYEAQSASGSLEDNMAYPPVEMWMQLNDNKVVDIESLQLVTVEGENNSFVCLPQCGSDLKITCQMTGRVIQAESEEDNKFEFGSETEGISETAPNLGSEASPETDSNSAEAGIWNGLFDAPSSKYPKLSKQAGVQKFLEDSQLNFSGKSATSIAPFMDVVIDGRSVRYTFVSVNYRRELDLEIGENQMAQVSIVDGGSLGGRRAEVRFIGDFSAGLDREAFDNLMDSTCRFVGDL